MDEIRNAWCRSCGLGEPIVVEELRWGERCSTCGATMTEPAPVPAVLDIPLEDEVVAGVLVTNIPAFACACLGGLSVGALGLFIPPYLLWSSQIPNLLTNCLSYSLVVPVYRQSDLLRSERTAAWESAKMNRGCDDIEAHRFMGEKTWCEDRERWAIDSRRYGPSRPGDHRRAGRPGGFRRRVSGGRL